MKPKTNPPQKPKTTDLKTAIAAGVALSDDFGHEMRVHSLAKSHGARVRHGWTYLDPLEKKPRQFDLRCTFAHDDGIYVVQLALECKNLTPDAPLVISGVRRTRDEAFYDVVCADCINPPTRVSVLRNRRDCPIYPLGSFVGKSLLRLVPSKEGLVSAPARESEIYGRWSQSLASADELCKSATEIGRPNRLRYTFILPAVVVPDGVLWTMEYDETGKSANGPQQASEASLFVNHEVVVRPNNHWMNLSHVQFFTLTGLREWLSTWTPVRGSWSDLFPTTAERHEPPVH